jgi:hypothetical protein
MPSLFIASSTIYFGIVVRSYSSVSIQAIISSRKKVIIIEQTMLTTVKVIPRTVRRVVTIADDPKAVIAPAIARPPNLLKIFGAKTKAHFVTRTEHDAIVKALDTTLAISLYF